MDCYLASDQFDARCVAVVQFALSQPPHFAFLDLKLLH
jgi:hypothetical protein